MWAHYANSTMVSALNLKLIPNDYDGKIYQVQYINKLLTYKIEDIKENLPTIITTKLSCFNYELEYRAIFEDCNKAIKDITAHKKHLSASQIAFLNLLIL
ncbi:hypothetical protein [Helicobacter turcicus]|uniref:DUF2971 domain-containing protein n=1 Tax=Helicobacter turcicus TaxID=2867412 RepID=A0ABS7JMB3_9HELI|nr:hypothetical protein [Helicobacter turcicus]MBX7490521.1 hypothetical protein [Helicobacter turcicus]MBX7545380.1 hypothetical protein [Helicobacter turcicus]